MQTLTLALTLTSRLAGTVCLVLCAVACTTPTPQAGSGVASVGTGAVPPAVADSTVPAVDNDVPRNGFVTRHAYYEPTRFRDMPGWSEDAVGESWEALRRSCQALAAKDGWQRACAAMASVNDRDPAAMRRFFETNFTAYQIRNVDRSSSGILTGYYEPQLNGSKTFGREFVYPVYGVPEDMLFLDSRRLPANYRSAALAARLDGRNVVPLQQVSTSNLAGVYALDLRETVPDIRDKKIRLRLDGGRIVPYYSRAEIERGALKAPVLCYVDDAAMLYAMHVQGAGKIRMRDGSILRLAFAEQNGRPFKPPTVARASGRKIVVRGVEIDAPDDEASQATDGDDADATSPLLTRGFVLANASGTAAASSAAQPASRTGRAPAQGPGKSASTGSATSVSATPRAFAVSDPSYVFFRPIPDSPAGPIGALGVPLSAGRSVAIDPRTTPLGAPVFVATRESQQKGGAINRLMMAQDTGGAIRGAVRADYFYGFGPQAQVQASRTNTRTEMWVLLPVGLKLAAQSVSTVRVRGAPAAAGTSDCLVADDELCVDDNRAPVAGLPARQ